MMHDRFHQAGNNTRDNKGQKPRQGIPQDKPYDKNADGAVKAEKPPTLMFAFRQIIPPHLKRLYYTLIIDDLSAQNGCTLIQPMVVYLITKWYIRMSEA